MRSNKTRWYLLSVLLMGLLIWFDHLTKALAVSHLMGTDGVDLIPGVLRLQYLENLGAAFGILKNQQWAFLLLAALFLIVAVFVYVRLPFTRRLVPLRLVVIFMAAGAIGNMIDRSVTKYVVDFIYFKLIDFPIFNVADIYVTCSAAAMVILVLFVYKDDELESIFKR